ncbi:hypothetical protein [Haliangium sp.]|uniref:hypothetical protein n=1 Tax=Haliangium sp. TaxID=2663208 RepID=UPI003D126CCF
MTLSCPRCSADIVAEDIHLDRGLAKCRACNAVFGLPAQLGNPAGPRRRGQVRPPKRFQVEERDGALHITRRWFRPAALGMILFAAFWMLFPFLFARGGVDGAALVVVLVSGAVGLGIVYWTAAVMVNRTHVVVDRAALRIRHSPLPWPGKRDLPVNQIDQLYCQSHLMQRRNRGASFNYSVDAVLRSGSTVRLISSLEQAEEAVYFEQAIERHLGIEDRHVPGEMPT